MLIRRTQPTSCYAACNTPVDITYETLPNSSIARWSAKMQVVNYANLWLPLCHAWHCSVPIRFSPFRLRSQNRNFDRHDEPTILRNCRARTCGLLAHSCINGWLIGVKTDIIIAVHGILIISCKFQVPSASNTVYWHRLPTRYVTIIHQLIPFFSFIFIFYFFIYSYTVCRLIWSHCTFVVVVLFFSLVFSHLATKTYVG